MEKKGKSGLRILDNSQDNFERNKTDVFGIETADLGKLLKVDLELLGFWIKLSLLRKKQMKNTFSFLEIG